MKIKIRLKRIAIAAAAYVAYVAMACASRGYITLVTALGDSIFPVAVYAALEAIEWSGENVDR